MSVLGSTSAMTVPFESGLRANADSVGRERRIMVPHKSSKVLVAFLQECEQ